MMVGRYGILGNNLPNVVVNDLVYHQPTNKLIAATYGRSMYSYDLEQDPLTQFNEHTNKYRDFSYIPNPFVDYTSIE